ncbi:MAG: tRNA 4-thiouridine(8) synthase ThiI [Candidatus Omnitrophota bacterium]|nr:tRNA 4-thiouridine(8) synthase ThiI [Candidatus Omnitrophota bacterium]
MNKIKAVSLISGGLDSTLATKIIVDLGIEVLAINFLSPFCLCNRRGGCKYEAGEVSGKLGIPLKTVAVHEDFLKMVKSPKHGYGSNLNPCIDCRIMMLKKAKEYMESIGASFVITGEVLGQRPMSQNRHSLDLIEKESGLSGLILRPLSAQLLAETIPEKMGWVNRQALLDISGRGRRPQMTLIKEFGINDYPCPSGGCLLTDPAFSQRARDLIKHGDFNLHNIELLKLGRHFRFSPDDKLIVGRNEEENNALERLAKDTDLVFAPAKVNGPIGLGVGKGFDDYDFINLASSIISRYCDRNGNLKVAIQYGRGSFKDGLSVDALPAEEAKIKALII